MSVDEIWLVRHGESTANIAAAEAEADGLEEIAVDHRDADVPLSELGRRQAEALGRELVSRGIGPDRTAVLVSPYRRAQETFRIAAEAADVAALSTGTDERLRDRELGVLDRLTRAGVAHRYPEEEERLRWLGKFYHRPAGGESWADVMLRLRSFLGDLDRIEGASRAVVVTHDVVVTLTTALRLGWDEHELLDFAGTHPVANASLTRLSRDADGGTWRLEEFSAVEHIADEDVTEHAGDRGALQP
jgi:broad specificity phosphatase PhoE